MPSLFVFDGDDTLWYAEYLYSQAYAEFFAFLYDKLGYYVPNIHFIYRTFFNIEDRNVVSWGVKRGRVADSMVKTYLLICEYAKNKWGHDVYDPEVELKIKEIGDKPFELAKQVWAPGAEDTLAELLRRGYALRLLTKYDNKLWPEKAAMLHTLRFFAENHVLTVHGKKELSHFEQLFSRSDFRRAYAVGNSVSDLAPVIENEDDDRWSGFYVPLPSSVPKLDADTRPTAANFDLTPVVHPRVVTLASLPEILRYV